MSKDKDDDEVVAEQTDAPAEGEIINPVQDSRRWVQIGDEPHGWHLIDQEKTAGNPSPVITMCGQETTSHLFLDRLPGGSDSDPGFVNEDCYEFAGISAPKKSRKAADEDAEPEAESSGPWVDPNAEPEKKATAKSK